MNKPLPRSPSLNRRQFLGLAWKGLLGLSSALGGVGLLRYFSYQPYPSMPTRFDLGLAEDISRQAATIIDEAQAILIPTGEGLQAFSLVCPHLGCVVELRKNEFICPCHNSKFDLQGTLKKGPAATGLRPLLLEVDETGHLILDIAPTSNSAAQFR